MLLIGNIAIERRSLLDSAVEPVFMRFFHPLQNVMQYIIGWNPSVFKNSKSEIYQNSRRLYVDVILSESHGLHKLLRSVQYKSSVIFNLYKTKRSCFPLARFSNYMTRVFCIHICILFCVRVDRYLKKMLPFNIMLCELSCVNTYISNGYTIRYKGQMDNNCQIKNVTTLE